MGMAHLQFLFQRHYPKCALPFNPKKTFAPEAKYGRSQTVQTSRNAGSMK
jgi:hypothetical protein